ncbi:MAG: hypothetical protein EBX68_09300, partial [Betaproteobacteria bacterium]|nr:hypothetical protein [Betaproteobacteria bacterium]
PDAIVRKNRPSEAIGWLKRLRPGPQARLWSAVARSRMYGLMLELMARPSGLRVATSISS